MKKTILTVMTLSLVAAVGCKGGDKPAELTSGIHLSNLDTTANPVDDFYQYACGGWVKNNPLDDEHSRYGAFDILADTNREQMKTLIDEITKNDQQEGTIPYKIATLYNVGMDSARLQQQGAEPIQALLNEINALSTREELSKELVALHRQGINPFFGLFSEADFDNSKMQIGWIYQAGTGMGERDYYLESKNKHLQDAYMQLMTKEFALAGYDKIASMAPDVLAKMVYNLETRLAKAQYDNLTNRDPFKTFHKMNVANAEKIAPAIGFKAYFEGMGVEAMDTFNMAQPEFITEVSNILAKENIETIKAYYAWNVINGAAAYLSDDFVNANFDFYGRTLSGMQQNRPRWKRVTSTLNGAMSEALGQMYVEKYFPAEAKDRMITLVNNLKEAFKQRITDAAWMNQATKEKAIEKLDAVYVKVGYPDKWRDYSKLEIKDDSYFANILRSNRFDVDYSINKINKPTDRDEWGMPPQMVNAYYNPTTNEICFPAAILQPPFFDMNADDAANYGAIGVVIGHEMSHGFDDQGRLYDKDGNLKDWWLPEDADNFKANAKKLAEYFSTIQVLDNPLTMANGELTLGENIADNGGLHISYLAMQNAKAKGQVKDEPMDGFTPEQRFFLAYAAVWANNIRNEEIVRLTNEDEHSLGMWRVNGTLKHVTEFVEAFGVKEGDGMWIDPEQRVTLW